MTPYRQKQSTIPLRTPALKSAGRGFTLIELMVVIVIIAVLVGIITPAVMSAMRRARETEVAVEISQLDTAINAFKAEYGGIAPPSSITFPDLTGLDLTMAADRATAESLWNALPRSKAIVRRIWPQFNFGVNGGNQGLKDSLNGAECLVFFLGGLPDSGGALSGFSKHPETPLDPNAANRVGPFFEFDNGRLTPNGQSGNPNAPEYKDPLPGQSQPYIYLSSYDGRGYRTADVTATQAVTTTTFTKWYTFAGGSAHKPKSHQIISPGADALYGGGGGYDGENYAITSGSLSAEYDEDNITNFRGGRLVP